MAFVIGGMQQKRKKNKQFKVVIVIIVVIVKAAAATAFAGRRLNATSPLFDIKMRLSSTLLQAQKKIIFLPLVYKSFLIFNISS